MTHSALKSDQPVLRAFAPLREFILLVAPLLIVIATGFNASAQDKDSRNSVAVVSPDGKNKISLTISEDRKQLLYSVTRDAKTIVEPSPIDIRLAGGDLVSTPISFDRIEERTIDKSSELLWGKSHRIHDYCHEASVWLKGDNGAKAPASQLSVNEGISIRIDVRAYDDGVAFRYELSADNEQPNIVIATENTEFRLAGDPSVIYMTVDHFHNSHEAVYDRKPLSDLPIGKLIDKPLLAVWPDGTAAAITEARLRHFAGMYFERPQGSAANVLRCRLSPRIKKPRGAVAAKTPVWSPWRVILLADQAGKLIEGNLLLCLNDPPDGDFSWISPGKTTWPWWNGTIEHGTVSTPASNFAINKEYIDFCARNKIAYHAISSVADGRPWYVQSGKPGFNPRQDTDVMTPRPDLGLPAILAYAKKKGVGIRLWVWWNPLRDKLEDAFATYERWGIKGLMIDFLDRDDQEMVDWQEKCLRAAARHKLEIQFHGSYKPTGEERTFPNLFNREGVLNLEYLKWSNRCTPEQDVNVAYTRLLVGPTDYHLGGFRAVARDKFKPRDELPFVLGSRCHQLAMYVVYENPMPMVCDVPSAYEGQPGFDFLVDVPTTWDETRFVAGDAGEYVVLARRSGNSWYLGGMTNWTARTVEVPLTFLGAGKFQAKLYLDQSLDGEKPNELRTETCEVAASETLKIPFATGGGMAAVFQPK